MYRALLLAALLAFVLLPSTASGKVEGTVRVSVDANGNQLVAPSGAIGTTPSLNASGTFVAFESLGPASGSDGNGTSDVFFRNVDESVTTLISVTPEGAPGNNRSYAPAVSGNGRYVAFESIASDLVADDSNRFPDIFVRDRDENTTSRESVSSEGEQADGPSSQPTISADGSTVGFCSSATNVVADDTNGVPDVFVRDFAAGTTGRIVPPGASGIPAEGCERIALSGDGATLAFSYRTDDGTGKAVSQVYIHNRATGETKLLSAANGAGGNGASGGNGLAISFDAGIVFFESLAGDLTAGDGNARSDVFKWQADNDELTRISLAPDGSEANGDSGNLGLNASSDGRYVVFASNASNLVPGDGNLSADIFRLDRRADAIAIVSVDVGDRAGNAPSYSPDVSDDGETVAFVSLASNLVYGDRNRHPDIFLRGTTFPVSGGMEGEPIATPAPDDTVSLPVPPPEENEGLDVRLVVGGALAAALFAMVAGWFVLGRRPQA